MPDIDSTATAGVEVGGYRRGPNATDRWDQYVVPVQDRIVSFRGRACSFRQLGIAGTAGQRLMTIFNAVGSTVIVEVDLVCVDLMMTAGRAVEQPLIRAHKLAAVPTGGTAIPKVGEDSAMAGSSASVTILQGTAAEGGAATAITATPAAGTIINQEFASRMVTVAGYEHTDRTEWFNDHPWTLRAGEGILVNLDYAAAAANPITDKWTTLVHWVEYTRP